jgi:AraC-like DNA-binding protein
MERIESQLLECTTAAQAAALLEDAVSARVRVAPDAAVDAAVAALDNGRIRVRDLAARLGLSERQLRRRCTDALGYGPKTLDRILRFQRFHTLAARRRDLAASPATPIRRI